MSIPNDTSPDAERVLTEIYRNMSVGQKWLLLGKIYRTAKTLHEAGVRANLPEATPEQIRESWLKVTLGDDVIQAIKESRHELER